MRGTRNGVRRQGNGKGGGRENGEGRRRHGLLLPSFFIFYFEQGQHSLPHFFAFRTGAAFAAPMSFHFVSNRGSKHCPCVFSFLFKRGQHLLPLCLFFSFRTGAASAAPVSFLFFSNGGSTCCPHVFSFHFEQTGGQCVGFMLPPFLSVLIGSSVYPHAAPFLSISNGGSVYHTRCQA